MSSTGAPPTLFAVDSSNALCAWRSYLRDPKPEWRSHLDAKPIADLFSGVGGLALGFTHAANDLGVLVGSQAAVDMDGAALEVYRANLDTRTPLRASVASLIDFQVRGVGETARFLYEPELVGEGVDALAGSKIVLAGPPCQGHSSLNNKTRNDDPRNRLYLTVPAIATATGAEIVVIENVPGVVRARGNVVDTAVRLLQESGYRVVTGQIAADWLGWPQTRKRFFVVAVREKEPVQLQEIVAQMRQEPLPVAWAIEDLLDAGDEDPMHQTADLSPENAARVAWLFEHDAYDMPNHMRPDCHKEGTSYGAVYGRMYWERPAPTLTTGFLTPGRGRFVHPLRRRTLTPREAARIQGFPDWFNFVVGDPAMTKKRDLGKWIGNAVPTILGYAAAMSALSAA